jgi:NADH dehydrogenase (ubiquinone) 1 alpha subcomplex subunit 4
MSSHFFKHYFRPEVTPLLVIIASALTGGVYVASHAAKAPDVVWDHKHNDRPWVQVKQGDQVKFWHTSENPQYTQRFKRERW